MAKKICLDAGHYGKYNRSPAVPAYYESDMNWKLHLLLKAALEKYGFEVKLTRSNQATDMALIERGKAAKGCDLFLSIHSNAVDGKVHEDIDYPVAYVPINGAGDKIGKLLSECIASVMGTTQKAQCWAKKSTSGTANWYGVIHSAALVGVTGIILEHSFHTNTRSTKWLMDENNLQKMAQCEADVIADYFGVKPETETTPAQTATPEQAAEDNGVWYLVSLGAYSVKKNAEVMLAKAKAAGFANAYITTKPKETAAADDDVWYLVSLGAYSVKKNAEAQLAKAKAAGFTNAYITTKPKETAAAAPKTEVEQPAEKRKTVDELAREVINGDWGNGAERKQRLTAAGYDYATIQNRVNELCKG